MFLIMHVKAPQQATLTAIGSGLLLSKGEVNPCENSGESETWAERAGSLPCIPDALESRGVCIIRTILGLHCRTGGPVIA